MLTKRLLAVVPMVFGVLLLTFLLVHLVPGDPVEVMLGESASHADRDRLRAELGLERPLPVQFVDYLGRLAQGDFGRSIHTGMPIAELLAQRIPATAQLALLAWGWPCWSACRWASWPRSPTGAGRTGRRRCLHLPFPPCRISGWGRC